MAHGGERHAEDQAHCVSTQDVDKTAKFYMDVFGMKEMQKCQRPKGGYRPVPVTP